MSRILRHECYQNSELVSAWDVEIETDTETIDGVEVEFDLDEISRTEVPLETVLAEQAGIEEE